MADYSAYHTLGDCIDAHRLATRLTTRTEKENAEHEHQSAEDYALACADATHPCPVVLREILGTGMAVLWSKEGDILSGPHSGAGR